MRHKGLLQFALVGVLHWSLAGAQDNTTCTADSCGVSSWYDLFVVSAVFMRLPPESNDTQDRIASLDASVASCRSTKGVNLVDLFIPITTSAVRFHLTTPDPRCDIL